MTTKVNCKSDSERLLLVEGPNDCHSVFHLVRLFYNTDPVFGLYECGNDDGVLDSLAARVVSSVRKQKILGIVLDTDIEGPNPEQAVASRLDQLITRVGPYYPLPSIFPSDGLVLDPLSHRPDAARLPRLGVWLMPNNRSFGMFEDLLMRSMAIEHREYTERIVSQARVDGIAGFKTAHLSKAIIRTYLAWQDPPDIQYLGLAIKRGTFKQVQTECQAFVRWIERLFGAPAQAASI